MASLFSLWPHGMAMAEFDLLEKAATEKRDERRNGSAAGNDRTLIYFVMVEFFLRLISFEIAVKKCGGKNNNKINDQPDNSVFR